MRTERETPLAPSEQAAHELALGAAWGERHIPPLDAAWAAGQAMTFEEAVAVALHPEAGNLGRFPGAATGTGAAAGQAAGDRFGLTRREMDVLRLVVDGLTDRDIGEALFIGHRTVASHVSSILAKLEVESRTAAATVAVRQGLV